MTHSLVSKQHAHYSHIMKISLFLKQFLKNPMEVGSLIPSSRFLAQSMLAGLNSEQLKCVVEYGPGNGSFTSVLHERLNTDSHFFAVEPNKFFADQIQTHFPRATVVRDYADRTGEYLGEKKGQVDLVVSGLPFSLMEWKVVESTVRETHAILKEGGSFRTFVYCHMSQYWKIRYLKDLLGSLFTNINYKVEIRNFPPAFVITCIK